MVNSSTLEQPRTENVVEKRPGTYVERAKATLRISYRDMDRFEQSPSFQHARVGRKYAPTRPDIRWTTTAAHTHSII